MMTTLPPSSARKRKMIYLGVLLLVCTALWFGIEQGMAHWGKPTARVVIAVPNQINAGAVFVAEDRKFFADGRLDVPLQKFVLGKDALQSMLQGKADLALVGDTPFMLAILNGEKIATVSTVFESRKSMSLLTSRNIRRVQDLAGKSVGTINGTSARYFLDSLLRAHGVRQSSVNIVDLAPAGLLTAFKDGTVDAITVWHPELEHAAGKELNTLYGDDVFVFRFLLVGKQEWIDRHPAEMRRVLAAIEAGNQHIAGSPDDARSIIGRHIALAPEAMGRFFDPKDFHLGLDQSLLLTLGDQARWAIRQAIVPAREVPNFLEYIRYQPLDAVLPTSIKLIR